MRAVDNGEATGTVDHETVKPQPGVVEYHPETPFALDGFARTGIGSAGTASRVFGPHREVDTPFLREYGPDGTGVTDGPRAEMYATLLGELYDEEFEEAVTDLVHEAAALAGERLDQERGEGTQASIEAARGVRDFLAPLERECEAMIDRLAEGLTATDLSTMTEDELGTFVDRFAPAPTVLAPPLDNFIGKLFKKAKKAVQGVVKLATKLSPVHILLGRLKKLVRPLLDRVLKFAINKLPVSLRPVAQQLARRFMGGALAHGEAGDTEDEGEAAAADPATITQEFDAKLAGYAVEGEDFEKFSSVEEFAAGQDDTEAGDVWRNLQRCRTRFAKEVTQLQPGEDPGPALEQFIPAVLAALKLGIKIIGRPKVISYLSKLLVQLVGKYVGREQAVPLSRALVDAGLQLAGLEVAADGGAREAGQALAATVEDTIGRVVRTAPESAWQNETLLEGYVRDAFAEAASAHFPDSFIRHELHEAAETSGVWSLRPVSGASKHYKKYSRVVEVAVTPQMAQTLKSFGGVPVHAIVRHRLRVSGAWPFRARVHLYEAVPGTTLSAIALDEKDVRGLGSSRREAWSLLHPLTPEAAGILLREPGLGRAVDPKFLAHGTVTEVGQRFYYLEPLNHLVSSGPGPARSPRTSHTKVVLDFPGGRARVLLYFAEAEAQALSAGLRTRGPLGVVLATLKAGLEHRLAAALAGTPTRSLRVVHEAVPSESLLPRTFGVFRLIGRPMAGALFRGVLDAFRREVEQRHDEFAGQVTRAAEDAADGITIVITFSRPPFFETLRSLLSGNPVAALAKDARAMFRQPLADYSIAVRPGYAR